MFLISFAMIFVTIIYLTVSYNKKANYIFALLFFDMAALISVSAVYVSKVSSYSYSMDLDYKLYMLLSKLPFSFYDIFNVFVLCLAMLMACFLAFYKLFYKAATVRSVLLYAIPIVLFFYINHSTTSWELFRISNLPEHILNKPVTLFIKILPFVNAIFISYYIFLALYAVIKEYLQTTLKFKKRYYLVIALSIIIIAAAIYCLLGFVFDGFLLFRNLDVIKFPVNVMVSGGYTSCFVLLALSLVAMLFTTVKKPFAVYVFRSKHKRNERISLGKNFSMILHKYKNAFYTIMHMTELLPSIFETGDKRGFDECMGILNSICHDQITNLTAMAHSCGEICLNMNDVDIISTIMSSSEQIKNFSKINCSLNDETESSIIIGDKNYLGEVFTNLFLNAAAAIEKKSPRNKEDKIEINAYNDDEYIVIKIRDNGTGIPKKQLKNIFKPFYTTGIPDTNIGIGLKIADDIITMHNGNIYVDSIYGEWTEFSVILPLK